MSLTSMEKVFFNVDIILQVYGLLDLEDQFRLSRVSDQFKEVFETFIWKQRYTTLCVTVRFPYFVITNETDLHRRHLKINEFKEFQRSYAADVEDLTIKIGVFAPNPYGHWGLGCEGGEGGELCREHRPTLSHNQVDLKLFHRVTKFSCYHMLVEVGYLNLIAECCPNLEDLSLIKFEHVFNYDELLSSLQKMRNLKVLFMKTTLPFPMQFKVLKRLLAENNLEQLQLSYNIDLSQIMSENHQALALPTRLKYLKIWTTCGRGNNHWIRSFSTYLGSFDNLSRLYITLSSTLTDKCLAILSENCIHLERLTFKSVKFKGVQSFVLPPKVHDLTLNWCAGLTSNNLRQILNQLKLKKFVSKNTNYVGAYGFRVSPHMLSLSLDDISTYHFKPAVKSHAHVQELAWFQREPSYDLGAGAALAAWSNLEILEIKDCDVAFDSIRQLKKLKKVIMPRRPLHLTWPFVIELLRHPFLEELTLRYPEGDDNKDRDYYAQEELTNQRDWTVLAMNTGIVAPEFKTNLRRLELSLEIFKHYVAFWLALFRQNDKLCEMRVICQMGKNLEHTLKFLICGNKLPKFLKTIDVCDIRINCKEFRKNFIGVMAKLRRQIDDTDLWVVNESYSISLQRSS